VSVRPSDHVTFADELCKELVDKWIKTVHELGDKAAIEAALINLHDTIPRLRRMRGILMRVRYVLEVLMDYKVEKSPSSVSEQKEEKKSSTCTGDSARKDPSVHSAS
jgi:hypothetical protein